MTPRNVVKDREYIIKFHVKINRRTENGDGQTKLP